MKFTMGPKRRKKQELPQSDQWMQENPQWCLPSLEELERLSHPTPMGRPPLHSAADDKATLVERLKRLSVERML